MSENMEMPYKEKKPLTGSALAIAMLTWEAQRIALDELEEQIKASVMALEATQTVGNVRASFSKGRGAYDYRSVGSSAPPEVIDQYTVTSLITDWKKVCEAAGIKNAPYTPGSPSVSVKLLPKKE